MKNVQCAAGPRAPAKPDSSCACVLFSLIFVCQTSEPSHALSAARQTTHTHEHTRTHTSRTNRIPRIPYTAYGSVYRNPSSGVRSFAAHPSGVSVSVLDGSAQWAIRLRHTANCTSSSTITVRPVRETTCRRRRRPTDSLPV